jgi:hypothetical protein
MLEQALLEFLHQDAPRRGVDARFRQLAPLHGLRQVWRFRHAAKLVHPRRHGFHVALGLGGVFHAPRRAEADEGRRDAGGVPLRQLASQSEVMPQSDRITPSKPYLPRSKSVSRVLLKPAAPAPG